MCASKYIAYEYMDNEDDIDDELKCFLCKHPFQSPVTHTLCHYDFCQNCVEVWLKEHQTCPTCTQSSDENMEQENESLNLTQIFRFVPISTRIVLNRLDQLLIQCSRCKELDIQRCDYEDHDQICTKKIVKCQSVDMKCTWKGPRDRLDKHLKICAFQKFRPIIDKLQGKIKTIERKQFEMKLSVKKLEQQMAFILAFINEGTLMKKICTIPSNQCQYKDVDQWNSPKLFSCQMCEKRIDSDQIAVHACNDGAICCFCFGKYYSMNETKSDLEFNNRDKEDYSPVSTLHSP
jgi:hypothetical protein